MKGKFSLFLEGFFFWHCDKVIILVLYLNESIRSEFEEMGRIGWGMGREAAGRHSYGRLLRLTGNVFNY